MLRRFLYGDSAKDVDPFFNPDVISKMYLHPDISVSEHEINEFFESNY